MKYFLSLEQDFPKKILKILKDKGFREEIMHILIDSKLTKEECLKAISHIIDSLQTAESSDNVSTYIKSIMPLLSKGIQTKVKMLSPFLDKIMKIENGGTMIYYTGEKSGNLIDYLKFITSPWGKFSSPEPPDIELLMSKLGPLSPPKAAFGFQKHPQDYTKGSKWVIT